MQDEKLPIFTIQVKPRNQRYCEYIVNDSLSHSKQYDDLSIYLSDLLPEKKLEIVELIDKKRDFIIFLQEKKIIELKVDFYKEMNKLSENLKHESIHGIQIKENLKKKTIEERINEISRSKNYDSLLKTINKNNFEKRPR